MSLITIIYQYNLDSVLVDSKQVKVTFLVVRLTKVL